MHICSLCETSVRRNAHLQPRCEAQCTVAAASCSGWPHTMHCKTLACGILQNIVSGDLKCYSRGFVPFGTPKEWAKEAPRLLISIFKHFNVHRPRRLCPPSGRRMRDRHCWADAPRKVACITAGEMPPDGEDRTALRTVMRGIVSRWLCSMKDTKWCGRECTGNLAT